MSTADHLDWHEANQRALVQRIAVVKHALKSDGASIPPAEFEVEPTLSTALDMVTAVFGLSPFEVDVLVLCAGVELDSEVGALCATRHRNPARIYPTFGLAMAVLEDAHWDALAPAGPLRRWRLVAVDDGPLTDSAVRIDESVLHLLAGLPYHDERLEGLATPARDETLLPASHQVVVDRIVSGWSGETQSIDLIRLCGRDSSALEAIAARACAVLGVHLEVIDAADLPAGIDERRVFARLCERSARLKGVAYLLRCDEGDQRPTADLVEAVPSILFAAGTNPVQPTRRLAMRIDVEAPSSEEQRLLWTENLAPLAVSMNGQVDEVVAQFNMGARSIRSSSLTVLSQGGASDSDSLRSTLWNACRDEARQPLDDLIERVSSTAGWDDLVLPTSQMQTLRDMALQVRHRSQVHEQWGFGEKGSRGLGITALFAGASGTGKTLAAEVIANSLELDLYRVDLSQVVSKYIGETEKNLRRVFEAAEVGGAVLLFDEADGLFGKRSEVKDSHDRYANLEVSYLLQRMETYRGLAILTTNLKSSLDSAFLRRLRFIVQFAFPDIDERAAIWRTVFPCDTPLGVLDYDALAALHITGGTIRNIGLQAAFLAAADGSPVTMTHLLHATHREYGKLEKSLTGSELRGWPAASHD